MAPSLLNEGFDSQPLRELAGLDRPTLRDAGDLFDRVLEQHGISVPDRRSAELVMLEYHLERLASRDVDPCEGAYNVWGMAGQLFDGAQLDAWVGFVGLASEYEDHPAARTKLGAEIVTLARDTLAQLRNPSVHSASGGTIQPASNNSDRKARIAAFIRRERLKKLAIWLAIAAFLVIYG